MTPRKYNYVVWRGSMRVQPDLEPGNSLRALSWHAGKRLQEVPPITATVSNEKLPDYIEMVSFLLVSLKLKNLLQEAGAEAEFFPIVQMTTSRGKPVTTPHFLLNILRVVECFDSERSQFTRYPAALGGGPLAVEHLVIHEERLANTPLATMNPLALNFLRRDLAERMRAEKIHGCFFFEIDKFASAMPDWPEES